MYVSDCKAPLFRGDLFPIRDVVPQGKKFIDFLDEKGKSLKTDRRARDRFGGQ